MNDGRVEAARGGDRAAFDALASEAMPKLRSFLWRMIGHREDSEDVAQAALAKAWQAVARFDGRSTFSTWLIAIASRVAIDHLRGQARWRRESQIAYANLCAENPAWQAEVVDEMAKPGFSFDARQHVAYCFVCVGRSLPPDEQAALVLRDVMEFSNREAANVLGTTESVLRHRLAAARRAMEGRYDGLCALVSKTGMCHQCTGLGMVAEAVGATKADLPDIDSFARRLQVVRGQRPERMSNRSLQDVFFRRCKEVETEGRGSVEPDSGCGEEP